MQITTELLTELKSKAKAATPGPWAEVGTYGVYSVVGEKDKPVCATFNALDKDFISAASQDVVLALIEELRIREKMCKWLVAYLVNGEYCHLPISFDCPNDIPRTCQQCAIDAARKAVEE